MKYLKNLTILLGGFLAIIGLFNAGLYADKHAGYHIGQMTFFALLFLGGAALLTKIDPS